MSTTERFEWFFWGGLVSAAVYVSLRMLGFEDEIARKALGVAVVVIKSYPPAIVALMVVAASSVPFLPRMVHAAMRPVIDRFNRRLSPDYERELQRISETAINDERERYTEKVRLYGQKERDRLMQHSGKITKLTRLRVSLEGEIQRLSEISKKYDEVATELAAQLSASGGQKANHANRLTKQKTAAMDEMHKALSSARGVVADMV